MPAPYPEEFKQRAIQMVRHGEPIMAVAKSLGIAESGLRCWIARDDIDGGRKPGLTSNERKELAELRRKNRRLEMENEILKRAAAYFALHGDHADRGPRPPPPGNRGQLAQAIFEYIESFYNPIHRHSSLAVLSHKNLRAPTHDKRGHYRGMMPTATPPQSGNRGKSRSVTQRAPEPTCAVGRARSTARPFGRR